MVDRDNISWNTEEAKAYIATLSEKDQHLINTKAEQLRNSYRKDSVHEFIAFVLVAAEIGEGAHEALDNAQQAQVDPYGQ
jgi:hypothetical protein